MPQAAALIGTYVLNAIGATAFFTVDALGATVLTATGAIVAEAIGSIVIAGAAYGASAALTSTPRLTPSAQKQNFRQAVAPRRRYYGRVKIGGVIDFLEVRTLSSGFSGGGGFGGAAKYLHSLVLLASQEFDGIEEYWIADQQVTLTGAGLVNEAPFFTVGVRRAKLVAQLGTSTQVAHPTLDANFPEWTVDHRCRGIANILGVFKSVETQSFNKVFPNGIPQIRVLARTAKVWDPADVLQDPDDPATWTFSLNGPQIIMDYVWHADGMRLPRELIELALDDWIEKIATADELVPLAGGGTEPRYRLSGGYEFTSPSRDVLPLMEDPMGAHLRMRGDGAIILDLPEYYEPDVIFADATVLTYKGLRRSPEAGDLRNEIRARYLSPENKYEEQEAEPWRNEASIAIDGTQSTTLDLTWCPSHAQARRRMKLEAFRTNPEWVGTIKVNAYGLDAIGERLIRVQITDLGLDAVFEPTSFEIDPETRFVVIGIRSMPDEAFEWDADDEEGLPPEAEDPDPDVPVAPPAPTGTLEEVVL